MAEGDNNDLTGLIEDGIKIADAIEKGGQELGKLVEQYNSYEKQIKRIEEIEKELSDARRANNTERVEELRREKLLLEDLTEATTEYKKIQDQLKNSFLDTQGSLQKLTSAFGDFGSVAVGIYNDVEKYKKTLEDIEDKEGIIGDEEIQRLKEAAKLFAGISIASKAVEPFANIFDKILSKTIALATAQIDAENNLKNLYNGVNEADGTTKSFVTTITELENAQTKAGFSTKELGIETGKLYTTFEALSGQYTLLRGQTTGYQQELVAGAAVLERTGVSLEDVGSAANTVNRIFAETADRVNTSSNSLELNNQLTADAAIKTIDFAQALNSIGIEAGLGPGVLVKEFNALSPQLLKIGSGTDDLVDTMSDLAYASRQTGIEMRRISDFASGFDTFEGAADRVGKLNAILGGDFLNVMDLMAAENPAERFQMVTNAITEQGKSFQDLTYYERLALAEAGNFESVGELAAAMAGRFDLVNNKLEDNAENYIAAADRAKEYQTFQQQIEATMVALSKQEGFSESVITGINAFLSIMQGIAENATAVLAFMGTMKALSISLGLAQLMLAANAKAATVAMGSGGLFGILMLIGTLLIVGMSPPLLDILAMLSASLIAIGVAAKIGGKNMNMGLVKVMLALGAAVMMASVGIGIAAEGIASMADSVSKLDGPQLAGFNTALIGLVGTLALFTTGIVALGLFATGPQMLGILGIGAAFLMIGAGIGVAAAGMGVFAEGVGTVVEAVGSLVESMATGIATMTDSFVKLFDSGVGGGALIGMAAGLYAMAASLVVFAAALAILTPAVLIFQGVTAVGKLFGGGPEAGDMESFTGMIESLASINPDNLTKTVEQVSKLRKEMSSMMESPDMIKDFTDMLKVFERDMQLAATINMQEKEQKAELTITSPITIKVDDNTQLIGKIDERVLAKLNFTRS